uniref:NADH:ubiquinone reductase (H(+)-translocating) n=1 Tax=Bipalium kewense TaxID=66750 RepID=A0A649UCX5_9PLAT|nr:NADH dehydrogenase subunit 5 [Bipalium kewense]QGI24376.1 NADH dehydrogenase subunit 5 [Bipalium kewense]
MFFFVLTNFCPLYIILDFSSIHFFDFFFFGFFFDYYSFLYLFVLFMIVSSIHLFISIYMSQDSNLKRFFFFLNSFVLSMVVLIISPNLISLMLGWDGLGFSSFLLVAWFGCFSSRFASLKTFLVNRLGDGLFLISLFFFFFQGHFFLGSIDSIISVVVFFLIFAFFTKSAHFPFSSWLPDAMAAPTPVSALVHSSTLVTAGLYLFFRFSYLISWELNEFVQYLGLWTLFLGSLAACFDYNSKKIVAYSTVSQLGFISFVLSLGCYELGFYYMMVHALIKALLFISVGCFLVLKNHNQDIRHLNNCWNLNPMVIFNLFFSCFSLSGFPFFSGYFVKEIIIGGTVFFQLNFCLLVIFCLSLIFTIFYTFRLVYIMGLNFRFNYGMIVELFSMNNFVFYILYLGVFGLGIILYNHFFCWMNFGSALWVLVYSSLGLILSFYVLNFRILISLKNFIFYFLSMFFLNILTISLNKVYLIGGYLVHSLDNGFFLFYFINNLNSLISQKFSNIFSNSYFVNWLSLVGFSFFFIFLLTIF